MIVSHYFVDFWPDGYHPYGPNPCRGCGKLFTMRDNWCTAEPAITLEVPQPDGTYRVLVFCGEGCVGAYLQDQGVSFSEMGIERCDPKLFPHRVKLLPGSPCIMREVKRVTGMEIMPR